MPPLLPTLLPTPHALVEQRLSKESCLAMVMEESGMGNAKSFWKWSEEVKDSV